MRRFPLATSPWFYAHDKAAPISTKVEGLTQESTRIFRLQPQRLSQRRRLPECWDLSCRSNERTYNRSPHRYSRRPIKKKISKQRSPSSTTQTLGPASVRATFHTKWDVDANPMLQRYELQFNRSRIKDYAYAHFTS